MRGAPRSSKHLFCNRIEIPVCFKFVPVCLLLEGSPLGVESRCQLAPQASCRTVPSAQADGPMPASGTRRARCPMPTPIRRSKRPLPIHSTRRATCRGFRVATRVLPPRPAAGPSRRPRPTGRYQHRAHGAPAAHCRRRFADRSGESRSAAADVLLS